MTRKRSLEAWGLLRGSSVKDILRITAERAEIAAGLNEALAVARGEQTYGDGFTHEALHVTYILMETFQDHVLDTRCSEHFPDVLASAKKVQDELYQLYQLIGTKFENW